jgi:hypothetical protein
MTRRFVNVTMGLMCIAPGVIIGAALLFDLITGKSPDGAALIQALPLHQATTAGRAGEG